MQTCFELVKMFICGDGQEDMSRFLAQGAVQGDTQADVAYATKASGGNAVYM